MEISINTRQAYSEVDQFLKLLSNEQRNEIPQKLQKLFSREKAKDYEKIIDSKKPIKEQGLKEETLAIIALLNLNYWCKDENEKERLKKIYLENERIYQKQLQEKFNPNEIFKKKENIKENVAVIEYKEPIIKRIINRIKNLFSR